MSAMAFPIFPHLPSLPSSSLLRRRAGPRPWARSWWTRRTPTRRRRRRRRSRTGWSSSRSTAAAPWPGAGPGCPPGSCCRTALPSTSRTGTARTTGPETAHGEWLFVMDVVWRGSLIVVATLCLWPKKDINATCFVAQPSFQKETTKNMHGSKAKEIRPLFFSFGMCVYPMWL